MAMGDSETVGDSKKKLSETCVNNDYTYFI